MGDVVLRVQAHLVDLRRLSQLELDASTAICVRLPRQLAVRKHVLDRTLRSVTKKDTVREARRGESVGEARRLCTQLMG